MALQFCISQFFYATAKRPLQQLNLQAVRYKCAVIVAKKAALVVKPFFHVN